MYLGYRAFTEVPENKYLFESRKIVKVFLAARPISSEKDCYNAVTSVSKGDLHCQCILSIFPASVHQFYANILVFININPFLYTNDQFALVNKK